MYIFPIKNGDVIPSSYISLPEGVYIWYIYIYFYIYTYTWNPFVLCFSSKRRSNSTSNQNKSHLASRRLRYLDLQSVVFGANLFSPRCPDERQSESSQLEWSRGPTRNTGNHRGCGFKETADLTTALYIKCLLKIWEMLPMAKVQGWKLE